jgi:hypothetical protein
MIGKQSLEIMLHQRVEDPKQGRDRTEPENNPSPPGGAAAQKVERDTHEAIDAHLDDHARHQPGDVTRGHRVRHRQPDV